MPFPVPNATDTEGIFEIFRFVNNQATGGLFFPIILLTIWIIAFIGAIAEARQASRAWIFASFVSVILGVILALIGFLDVNWVYLLVLMLAGGLFWIRLQNAPA